MDQIARDWREAGLNQRDAALCDFAEELSLRPGSIGPGGVERLRQAGFDDRAIHDAAQVISYFNYINRLADGLGVAPEEWIRKWGEENSE